MKWIYNYQLFLFDFDGLLVDTEHLHYQAYLDMCAQRGYELPWSFDRFSEAAYHPPFALRDQIYAELPKLQRQEPNWEILHEEKTQCFLNLIKQATVPLLPGVADLLLALHKGEINHCVVTHSPASLIEQICQQNRMLQTIPHWMTREDYNRPKPHPECYQRAITQFSRPHEQIIGFEDSLKGLHALLETKAKPVLICPPEAYYVEKILQSHPQIRYYPSFNAITDQNAPFTPH